MNLPTINLVFELMINNRIFPIKKSNDIWYILMGEKMR